MQRGNAQNMSRYAGRLQQKNVLRASLYDFQTYASAGTTQLTFFQSPAGSGTKTREDTNMEIAGSLSAGKSFLVQTIELYLFPGVPISTIAATATNTAKQADDMYVFHKKGFLDFFYGSQSILTEAPLGRFPASSGLSIDSSLSGVFTAPLMVKNEYGRMSGLVYRMEPEHLIESSVNFNITLNWGTAQALPSGVDARVGVVLRGLLRRNAQ